MSPDSFDLGTIRHLFVDALVILFLVSAVAKLLGLAMFRFGLQLLPFVTAPVAAVVSIALPIAELVVAVGLFLDQVWARWAALAMLLLFSAIALLAVAMGRQVPCGCFGQLDGQTLSWRTILRNALLILLVALVFTLQPRTDWALALWPSGLLLLVGLSLAQVYKNHRLILGLRHAKIF
jgi:hypothetical protein